MYSRVAILSDPSEKYNNEHGLCDIKSDEKAFRDAAFGVLKKASIKIPASKVYLKFNDSHSLTAKSLDTFGGCRSFDERSSSMKLLSTFFMLTLCLLILIQKTSISI